MPARAGEFLLLKQGQDAAGLDLSTTNHHQMTRQSGTAASAANITIKRLAKAVAPAEK